MKKIIILLILLLQAVNVEAKEIITYTNYSDYLYSETEIKNSDLIEVNKVRKYKWYKEKQLLSEKYYLEKPIEFEYKSNIYEKTDFSNWSSKLSTENVDKEERLATYYKEYRPIRYIRFTPTEDIKISEFNIYNDGKEIDYTIICGQCDINIINKLKDNNKEEEITIKKDKNILINMILPLKIDKLEFEIYSKNINDLLLTFNGDYFVDTPDYSININSNKIKYDFYESKILTLPLDKTYVTYDPDANNKLIKIVSQRKEYRTYKKSYKYYNLIKEYLDDYYEIKEGYIKDTSKYKDYYKYKIRNKIITNNIKEYIDKIITINKPEIKYKTKVYPVEKINYIKEKEEENKIEKYGIYTLIGFLLKKMSIFG